MASDPSSGSPGGAVVGFFIGAFFGSAIGIAGFGTAIAGTVPIGILGAWLGYRHCKPVVPDHLEVRKPDGALKYVKRAVLLALDLLVLFLLFIRKILRRSNQRGLEDREVKSRSPTASGWALVTVEPTDGAIDTTLLLEPVHRVRYIGLFDL
jgi:hypothetical protein